MKPFLWKSDISFLNSPFLLFIIGESKKFAIFSYPDGRTVKYEEDTILSNNLMILDIFSDRVYIKINDVEHSIDLKNNLVKTEGWHLI